MTKTVPPVVPPTAPSAPPPAPVAPPAPAAPTYTLPTASYKPQTPITPPPNDPNVQRNLGHRASATETAKTMAAAILAVGLGIPAMLISYAMVLGAVLLKMTNAHFKKVGGVLSKDYFDSWTVAFDNFARKCFGVSKDFTFRPFIHLGSEFADQIDTAGHPDFDVLNTQPHEWHGPSTDFAPAPNTSVNHPHGSPLMPPHTPAVGRVH